VRNGVRGATTRAVFGSITVVGLSLRLVVDVATRAIGRGNKFSSKRGNGEKGKRDKGEGRRDKGEKT